jgi:acyl-CoA thioesterase I
LKRYVVLLAALACSAEPPRADSAQANVAPTGALAAADSGRAAPRPSARPTILFAGTSLTAGLGLEPDSAYPQQIQRMIDSAGLRYEVINAGVSGETSASLLGRLDWLLREPFDLMVIETGAIQQAIERVKAARPQARIALVQMEAPPNLGAVYTNGFREAFAELARVNGVALLPFLLQDVAGVRELNQGDGIHPNYEGERIVARNVWKGLRPLLR